MNNEKVMGDNGEQDRPVNFKNVQIGDPVWHFEKGWMKVVKIEGNMGSGGHFVATKGRFTCIVDVHGSCGSNRMVFWDSLIYKIPSEPERKKIKYVNIYISNDGKSFQTCGAIHDSKKKAIEKRSKFFKFYQMVSFEVGK